MPLFFEQVAFVIKLPVCSFFAAKVMCEILREFEAKLPVQTVIGLIGIDHQDVIAMFLICSCQQRRGSTLAAAAFSAKYYLHCLSPLFYMGL